MNLEPRTPTRQTTTLVVKMIGYSAVFLAFILVGLPWAFHYLGVVLFNERIQQALRDWSWGPVVGGGLFALGLALYLFCSLWLVIIGRGPFVEFDPPTRFVASGPYRWMRNPIAAALLITVLGEGIYFGSSGILFLVFLGLHWAQYQVVCIEEPRLQARFGQDYVSYCGRVSRWLPRPPRDEPATTLSESSPKHTAVKHP